MIKRVIQLFSLLTTGLILLAAPVSLAFDPLGAGCRQGAGSSSVCQTQPNGNPLFGPNGVITKATSVIATIVGVAAVIMIIIGGFKYITSSGDSSNVESAKNTILYAIIGLVIALVAQSIVIFVLRKI